MLLVAMAVISVVLMPANWFGSYYLLPAALSLALVGASIWAYAAGSPELLLGLTIASAVLGFVFGLVPFAWHAVLVTIVCVLSLLGKPEPRRFAAAALVMGVVPFGLVYGPDVTLARDFSAMRRQYPLRSVAARLEYEHKARSKKSPARESRPAAYSSDVLAEVEKMEQREIVVNSFHLFALEKLHTATYREFVRAPGFGFGRMSAFRIEPQLDQIGLPPRKVVELPLPVEGTVRPVGPELLSDVHRLAARDFLARERIGYVRSREEVAGFESHGFGALNGILQLVDGFAHSLGGGPQIDKGEGQPSHWQVARLELVSLLRHAGPRVYVSQKLPQMDQLAEVPHRALDDFERGALPQLRFEKDIVTEIASERIKMLGSIRAGNDCLQCHGGERGQLLGAFSYELTPTAASTTAPNE
jgi:hypothetical protein